MLFLDYLKGMPFVIENSNEEEQFLTAIRNKPYDELTWQVYADWLEERGDVEKANAIRNIAQNPELIQNFLSPPRVLQRQSPGQQGIQIQHKKLSYSPFSADKTKNVPVRGHASLRRGIS